MEVMCQGSVLSSELTSHYITTWATCQFKWNLRFAILTGLAGTAYTLIKESLLVIQMVLSVTSSAQIHIQDADLWSTPFSGWHGPHLLIAKLNAPSDRLLGALSVFILEIQYWFICTSTVSICILGMALVTSAEIINDVVDSQWLIF